MRPAVKMVPGGLLGMEPGDGVFVGLDGGMADADSFIQIVWRESDRCGNESIDEQHQQLFKTSNI